MRVLRSLAASVVLVVLLHLGAATPASAQGDCTGSSWVTGFESAPSQVPISLDAQGRILIPGANQTFRDILTTHVGGSAVRVRLSNRFGSGPVTFPAVTVAQRTGGAAIDGSTTTPVTFNGARSVTVPAGATVVSDPATFTVTDFDDVAVSVYASNPGTVPTEHFVGRQTSYATAPLLGDHTADAGGAVFSQPSTARWFVSGLDVLASGPSRTVVAFGDSLTDGFQGTTCTTLENTATVDRNRRYPDLLQHRIDDSALPLSVANAGISGSGILDDQTSFGATEQTRIDQDVVGLAGVTDAIVYIGINDIGAGASAEELEAGYTALIARLHAAGVHVIQATLTPAGNYSASSYSGPAAQAVRDAVNTWIRTSSPADSVVDFDAAVRDRSHPEDLAAAYDGGDGLHLSPAGYQALADAVDLTQLRGSGCPLPLPPCPATRSVRLHVHSEGLISATATVAGKTVATFKPGRTKATVVLKSSSGTVKMKIRVQRKGQAATTRTRTFSVCVPTR